MNYCNDCGSPLGGPDDLHTCSLSLTEPAPSGADRTGSKPDPSAWMTREQLIRMANKACNPGIESAWHHGFWMLTQDEFERFAHLVAAASAQSAVARVTDSDIEARAVPLYTTPPARQPLTDEQIQKALSEANVPELPAQWDFVEVEIARAIERAHGIGGDA